MASLLEQVVEANGGARLASFSRVTARVDYGGTLWGEKGHPSFLGGAVVEASVRDQWIRQTNVASGRQMIFDRSRDWIVVMEPNGDVIEEMTDPRRTFDGYSRGSPWDVAQAAYFRCYTTWHYLLEPFDFTFPGTTSGEIEGHAEHGERWRGLRVTFPPEVDSHNQTQLYYFDEEYRLRRTDLQPEVNDFSRTTQYSYDHVTVDGITLPRSRRVYLRRLDRSPDTAHVPLTVDVSEVRYA